MYKILNKWSISKNKTKIYMLLLFTKESSLFVVMFNLYVYMSFQTEISDLYS